MHQPKPIKPFKARGPNARRKPGRPPKTEMALLHEDDELRLSATGPRYVASATAEDNGVLVVSFTGVGAGSDAVQSEEFRSMASAAGRSVLFVGDKTRSWYNTPGLYERILDLVAPHVEASKTVITLGNSMGGFGAMLFAGPLKARAALAFGPQISVSRRVIPKERRWGVYVDQIKQFRFEDLNDYLVDGPTYAALHGSGGKDAFHIAALKPRPGLRHFVLPGERHNVSGDLKKRGQLAPLVEAGVNDDWATFERLAREAGAVPRAEAGDVVADFQARKAALRGEPD